MSKQPGGMIIGQKNVQYGLQKAVPKKPGLQAASSAQRKVAPSNVFGDGDSDEEDVERQISRQADKKRAAAKVQQVYEEALAEDPSVFDYDGVYDSIQEARVATKQQDKVQRQSKYIASLLEQAQQRKREQDVLYERRVVRERQQEDHLFEDKERFVTGAYRRKLEEDKKWLEVERQKELDEQRNDVRKVGHMGNFYANLLTKNVAYGTAKRVEDPVGDGKTGKMGPEGLNGATATREDGGGGDREAAASPTPDDRDGGGGNSAAAARRSITAEAEEAAGSAKAKTLAQLDRYDTLRLEAERGLRERRLAQQQEREACREEEVEEEERQQGAGPRGHGGAARPAVESPAGQRRRQRGDGGEEEEEEKARRDAAPAGSVRSDAPAAEQAGKVAMATGVSGGAPAAGPGGVGTGADASGGGKRRNDETAVQSARERYLARKQQKTS